MKEIMISPNRHGNIISTNMISLDNAIRRAQEKFIVSMIYQNNFPRWIQLIMVSRDNRVEIRDIPTTSENGLILPSWRGRDIREFITEITATYPRSEFYLIEEMSDLCKLLKARCPRRWWED